MVAGSIPAAGAMKEDDSKSLKGQIEALNTIIVDSAKLRLENNQIIINNKIKEAIEIYSNNIKNLGIVSGTVAPFSLSLLTISELNIYSPFLLSGFFILLVNIILSQQLLSEFSADLDKKTTRAQFKHFLAESEINKATTTPTQSKDSPIFEYLKEIEDSEKLLGISKYSTGHWDTIGRLRKYNKYINSLFVLGACLIMLSTVFMKVLDFFN